jgi:hypothetical protein
MATKQTYVVWAPNDTKPEVLERRTALWGDHMNNMMRLVKEGAISVSFVSFGDTKYLLDNNNRGGRTVVRFCIG